MATYVATCEECQRNKPSNLRLAGLLQPLEVPGHRWERISMDFVTHLPKTKKGYDALLVMVDYVTRMMIFANYLQYNDYSGYCKALGLTR